MSPKEDRYALSGRTAFSFEQALERVRTDLKEAGFGILSEIDVQAKLREKLGVEVERQLILGACNPALAREALAAEPDLGVLLPCNVVVYEREGETHVAAVEPKRMLSIVGNERLEPIADQVHDLLAGVVQGVWEA